jgi:ABC-type glycerol-3-phosphate transport system substrate-binding protein
MSDLTQDKQDEEGQGSAGEIFSNPSQSTYGEAIAPEVTEELPSLSTPSQEQETQQVEIDQLQNSSLASGETTIPPPPFEEDKKKKFIFLAAGIFGVILLVVLIVKLLSKGGNPPPAKNITLTYWGLWEEKEIMQGVLDEYKKSHPNITINYVKQDSNQYRERLKAAIDKGEGPDIFRFHNTWVPMMVSYLAPVPKTVYAEEEFKKTFYPVATADLKKGNNYYGIPLMIDGLLLYYNEDILKSANVPVPSTWVDMQKAVVKLTVKQKERIITSAVALGTAENIEHFSDILGLMMFQNGVNLGKSFFSCSDLTKKDCAVDVLTFYRKFAEAPDNTWDDTLENSITAFAKGHVAMIMAPSWQAFVIKEISKNTNLNFKTAPVPQLPCEKSPCPSVNWATYWVEGVSGKSSNQSAAWEFLKYLSMSSTMQKLYAEQIKYRKLFGEPYSRVYLGKSLSDNPYLAPLISSAPSMKSFYLASRTFDGETGLNSSLIKYLKDAVNSLSQGVSIETALKTADQGFSQVFERFGINTSSQ